MKTKSKNGSKADSAKSKNQINIEPGDLVHGIQFKFLILKETIIRYGLTSKTDIGWEAYAVHNRRIESLPKRWFEDNIEKGVFTLQKGLRNK